MEIKNKTKNRKPVINHGAKKDFPLLNKKINGKEIVYLDSAATTQKPFSVIKAIENYYYNYNANVHRGIYRISEEATVAYELAHKKVAEFIHCHQEEIIFTKNATESINLLAYSFQNSVLINDDFISLREGDEILLTIMEHHSNFVPWQQLAKRIGLKLRFLEIDKQGKLIIDEKKFTNRTKIVAATHVSNVLGTINDIKTIVKLAHKHNALVVVDAAQSVPHMPVDVKDLDCDFMVFSGHKMLASTGIGCLYGKRELLEKMQPFLFGGDMIRSVDCENTTWNDLPMKFEAGTPPVAEAISMIAAIDYLNKIGMKNVRGHEIELTKYALGKLEKINGIAIYGSTNAEERGGVISFNLQNIHPHDIATVLDKENIAIRAGNHCAQPLMRALQTNATCRISFYVYNTLEDVDKLVKGLEIVNRIFTISNKK
ncbi:cysteine desulfurase [Candidatus Woesearchaeota archaeon]|nr:cysteine desulfurase [Candidatus Woesearchaeota archaeon]